MGTAEVVSEETLADSEADPMVTDLNAEPEVDSSDVREKKEESARSTSGDPWGGLIQAGLTFFSQLAAQSANAKASDGVGSLLETDPATGRSYLRLPVPDPAALAKLAEALQALLPAGRER
jgi:hypothetical protein